LIFKDHVSLFKSHLQVGQLHRLVLAAGATPGFLGWRWAVPHVYHATHMLQVRQGLGLG
jgi:hypothetical protein